MNSHNLEADTLQRFVEQRHIVVRVLRRPISVVKPSLPIGRATRDSVRTFAGNNAIKRIMTAARSMRCKVYLMHFEPEHPIWAPARVERRTRLLTRYDPLPTEHRLPLERPAIGALGATGASFFRMWSRVGACGSCFEHVGVYQPISPPPLAVYPPTRISPCSRHEKRDAGASAACKRPTSLVEIADQAHAFGRASRYGLRGRMNPMSARDRAGNQETSLIRYPTSAEFDYNSHSARGAVNQCGARRDGSSSRF